jgi:GxxExxY protein
MTDLLYRDECYHIQSCIFNVNRKLGSGFLESVYQEAMEIEMNKAKIPFEAKKVLKIMYDGVPLVRAVRVVRGYSSLHYGPSSSCILRN